MEKRLLSVGATVAKFAKLHNKIIVALSLILLSNWISAQDHKDDNEVLDSLKQELNKAQEDTNKINLLQSLSKRLLSKDIEKALFYASESLRLAQDLKNDAMIAGSCNQIGIVLYRKGYLEASRKYILKAKELSIKVNDIESICTSLNNEGVICYAQGNLDLALGCYLKSLKMAEELNDSRGVAMTLNNIGNIHKDLDNFEKSLEFYERSIDKKMQIDDVHGLAMTYNNIGLLFSDQKKYTEALKYYEKSIELKEKIDDQYGLGMTINNMGLVHQSTGAEELALEHFQKSIRIKEKIGDQLGMAMCYSNIGKVFLESGKYTQAISSLDKAMEIAVAIDSKIQQRDACLIYFETYQEMVDYPKALTYYKRYVALKDSMISKKGIDKIADMQTKYEMDMKESEIELLQNNEKLQAAEINRQKIISWSFGGILLLVMVSIFLLYNRLKLINKQNEIIKNQKQLVDEKNLEITEANRAISDSISYAKRIQASVLPSQNLIDEILGEYFVLDKPKDVVSGDFYWINKISQHESLIAVVDCTGDGVPGALMSVICNQLLNEVITENKVHQPAIVLDELKKGIIKVFQKRSEYVETLDGMDLALCLWNSDTMVLEYAGAKNPLHIVRPGIAKNPDSLFVGSPVEDAVTSFGEDLCTVLPNKVSVNCMVLDDRSFSSHQLQLIEGDLVYMFTDGIPDQIGGEGNEKFSNKKLKELILSVRSNSMEDQESEIDNTITEYIKRGKNQTDDMLMLAFRV